MGGTAVHRNRQNKYHGTIGREYPCIFLKLMKYSLIPHNSFYMHQNDIKNGEHDVLPTLLLMTVM